MINNNQILLIKNRLVSIFDEYSYKTTFLINHESELFEDHQCVFDFDFDFKLAIYELSQYLIKYD